MPLFQRQRIRRSGCGPYGRGEVVLVEGCPRGFISVEDCPGSRREMLVHSYNFMADIERCGCFGLARAWTTIWRARISVSEGTRAGFLIPGHRYGRLKRLVRGTIAASSAIRLGKCVLRAERPHLGPGSPSEVSSAAAKAAETAGKNPHHPRSPNGSCQVIVAVELVASKATDVQRW